ncbi:hypothetical protein [Pelagibius sp. Alg239-R121]|uniref:hypothetical protein n=1 Tax=Pelagibius sp. Alg239-R121 TaxID=2993448 RepID=UPI0024A6D244|nr:hypothetical protein [Pelagibius sp. Alg239-R121]
MVWLLTKLGRHATQVLFVGVFIGLALPSLASLFRPLLAPAVIILLFAALLRVNWAAMAAYFRQPGVTGLLTIWLLLVSPILTWLLLDFFPIPESLSAAVVLMAAAPPILGSASIAMILGLDGALVVVGALLATLLTPLTVPPLALQLLGIQLDIGLGAFMGRLGLVVAIAFAGALIVRRFISPEALAARAQLLDGIVVTVMLIFAIAIMAGVTDAIFERPETVALWTVAAFVANPVLQLLGIAAFSWLGLRKALSIGLLSGNCNMGLLLAALPAEKDADVLLFFAIAQLPMYMLPVLMVPFYRRLLNRNTNTTQNLG